VKIDSTSYWIGGISGIISAITVLYMKGLIKF